MSENLILRWLRGVGLGRKGIYRQGIALYNQGQYEEALERFMEITASEPVSYSIHH